MDIYDAIINSTIFPPRNRQDEFCDKNLELFDGESININTNMDIGAAIRKKMSEQGTTTAWLARKVNCDRGNLRKQLHNMHIYPELLLKISIALKTNFFVYYSDYFQQVVEKQDNTL
jgi:hypothetical protein